MIFLQNVKDAQKRINKYVKKTPVVEIRDGIFLKLENKQPIVKGFKIRGAASSMIFTNKKKVMTSALGTHGFAVGYIGKKLGIKTICMMITNPPKDAEKKMKILVDEVMYGTEKFSDTEQMALRYAKRNNIHFVHPYNDKDVIAGQGTIGLELLDQIKDLDAVYVPIGGGGLISGIAVAVKSINPKIKVIGVQPQQMHAMIDSVKKKKVVAVSSRKSVAEKLAVNLNPKTITFKIVQKYVDYFIMPTEVEVKKAMKEIYLKTREVVEGAGAIAYAAALKDRRRKKNVGCVVSGGNISKENFRKSTGIQL